MSILINDPKWGGLSGDAAHNTTVIQIILDVAAVAGEIVVIPDGLPSISVNGLTLNDRQRLVGNGSQLKLESTSPITLAGDMARLEDLWLESVQAGTLIKVTGNHCQIKGVEANSTTALTALEVDGCFGLVVRDLMAKGNTGTKTAGSAGVRLKNLTNSVRFYGGTIDHWENIVEVGGDCKSLSFFASLLENPSKNAIKIIGYMFGLQLYGCTHENGERFMEHVGPTMIGCHISGLLSGAGSLEAIRLAGPTSGMIVEASRFTSYTTTYKMDHVFAKAIDIGNDHNGQAVVANGPDATRVVFLREWASGRKLDVYNTTPTFHTIP